MILLRLSSAGLLASAVTALVFACGGVVPDAASGARAGVAEAGGSDADDLADAPSDSASAETSLDAAAADVLNEGAAADPGVDAAACTAQMLASVKTTGTCDGPNPGTSPYTGILDFACANTSVDAPDRAAKLTAFCASHPFAGEAGPFAHGGGFVCLCFVV